MAHAKDKDQQWHGSVIDLPECHSLPPRLWQQLLCSRHIQGGNVSISSHDLALAADDKACHDRLAIRAILIKHLPGKQGGRVSSEGQLLQVA